MSRGHVWVSSSPPTSGLWAGKLLLSPVLTSPHQAGGLGRAEQCHQLSPEPHSTQALTPGKQNLLLGK